MFSKIQNKELDLLAAYNRKEGPSKSSKVVRLIAIPLSLIVFFGAIYLYLFISNYHLQKQIDEVNLSNEELQLKIDSTDKEPYNELTVLQGTYSSLEAIDNYVSGLSKIDKQNILQLQKKLLSGMTLNSISYNQDSKEMTVSYTSSNVQNIEKYVTILRNSEDYAQITYTGYQQGSSTTSQGTGETNPLTGQEITTDTVVLYYNFSLVLTMNGGAQ